MNDYPTPMDRALDDLFHAVKGYVERSLQPLADRTKALEKRNAELEGDNADLHRQLAAVRSKGIEYRGVWEDRAEYQQGDVVTDKGSMWVARGCSRGMRPGASDAWQLAVKRGKNSGER